jgi:hypothetical protein
MGVNSRLAAVAVLVAAAGIGCGRGGSAVPAAGLAAGKIVLPFIENDYTQALSRAREAGLPIFIEVWAPW